jgi:uncharacterized protein (DUF1015 family)
MPLIKPFAGLRPAPGRAADVAAPPYDVMNAAEARRMVHDRPWSFLHISRPEVDLPTEIDPFADAVYNKARENLELMLAEGVLIRDPRPCYYVYRLTMGRHRQTGLVAATSVAAYDAGRIKQHELTRPAKEDDRVRQIDALDAQTGPVFLVYRANRGIDELLMQSCRTTPEIEVVAEDGVCHQVWSIDEAETLERLSTAFDTLDALYVADGHHRSAAASRVARARRAADLGPHQTPASAAHTGADAAGEAAHQYFLSVIFPHDQMQILPYNRVLRDLNGLDRAAFMHRVGAAFQIAASDKPVQPAAPAEFGMYLDGHWYRLRLDPRQIPTKDPVRRLDVSLLQDHLIGPILGIDDPRRDERIDFVGGVRGLAGLSARVDDGDMRIAFSLYPTQMDDLMAVADAGKVMPPKSTWFEPKLADGLVSHVID